MPTLTLYEKWLRPGPQEREYHGVTGMCPTPPDSRLVRGSWIQGQLDDEASGAESPKVVDIAYLICIDYDARPMQIPSFEASRRILECFPMARSLRTHLRPRFRRLIDEFAQHRTGVS